MRVSWVHRFQYSLGGPFYSRLGRDTTDYYSTTDSNWSTSLDDLATLLSEKLGVTCHYFDSADILRALLTFEQRILQDECPDIVAESIGVQMSLPYTRKKGELRGLIY